MPLGKRESISQNDNVNSETDSDLLDQYKALNEKCDITIKKIQKRKSKKQYN